MFGFSSFAQTPFAALGTSSVQVAVTGVSASGAVGTATASAPKQVTVTGVTATGSTGSVTVKAKANLLSIPLVVLILTLEGLVLIQAAESVYCKISLFTTIEECHGW